MITIIKECFDDIQRMRKDKDINNKNYEKLKKDGKFKQITSSSMKVGDIIKVH